MTTDRDPFEALAASDPARSTPRFDAQSERGRQVFEWAKTRGTQARGRRHRPGPRFLAIAIAVGAVGAAAAAAFIDAREPRRTQQVACVSKPTGSSKTVAVGPGKQSVVDRCWRLWRNGAFYPEPTPSQLVACITRGGVAVYPGGPDVCARLGLPLARPDARAAPAVSDLRDILHKPANRCLPPGRAREVARQALDSVGLDDWRVGPAAGFTDQRPCPTFDVDEVEREVRLIPTARSSS